MNYLAHIHLGALSRTSKLGNFLGDFVKGSNLTHLQTHLQVGIKLHRSIDSYTDKHPLIQNLREAFPKNLRRMSGVVIDIYFDYLLCIYWHEYRDDGLYDGSSQDNNLQDMLAAFYEELEQTNLCLPGRFDSVKASLLQYRWLENYQDPQTCFKAFRQIESRLNNRIQFADLSKVFIQNNKSLFEATFTDFYPQLIAHSKATRHILV